MWQRSRGKNILGGGGGGGGGRLQNAKYLVSKSFKQILKVPKHPSIRLFIIEQDPIGKPKKTENGIQPRNRTLSQNSPIDCDGVQLYQYWTTLRVNVYLCPITELIKSMHTYR